ncbi:restriction endonuclease subunit S [Escherichia coli]|uniref:restriction endonuclease subunit S n=1 Tax=Escherichia coli TaxID=562 RepID=UPI00351DA2C9
MSFEWREITLGDFLTLKRGYDLPKSKRKDGHIPIISSSGFSGVHNVPMVDGPGVVTGRYGTIGQVFYIPEKYWPLNTTLYVEDFKGNSPLFIYYLLQTINFHTYSDKAAVPGINRNHVHMANIRVPTSRTAQDKIALILKKIDDKIISNQNINKILEQIAQTLFKSWFVDFEPVKAKMEVLEAGGSQEDATLAAMTAISGKDTDALAIFERESPEQYAELKNTAELFPSAMQDSELGEIPEGWSSQRFSNIATLNYGKKKTERIEGPYPVYGSGGITGSHNNYLIEGPSVIVGRKGSIGTLYWEDGKFHPIDTVYYVVNKDGIPLSYLYYLMETLNLPRMNTDAAVPGLNRDNVYRLEVLKPILSVLNKFNSHISAIRNMIQKNNVSTATLTVLRDTLLPKLLSGEITLPEAEQTVSEVENV